VATPLYDVIAARAPVAVAALGEPAVAERTLVTLCEAAAATWPDIAVEPVRVIAALADKLATDDAPAIEAANVAELYLALACARGDDRAIAAFDRAYLDVVPYALRGMKLAAATVEDIRAAVRDKLLLADGDRAPRVIEYAGRGRLRGLVQVTATRMAIDRLRADEREQPLPDDRELAAPGDLELSLIKAQYRDAFAAAFTAAVGELSQRDRNLLRLHVLGGVTLEQLAQMYGVHRATVVRWLAAAREAVLDATRGRIAERLGASERELDELFELVRSRVELSVDRLLASVSIRHH
jgi:RNA polymerase sigma-70 factor (ECF subfamily)